MGLSRLVSSEIFLTHDLFTTSILENHLMTMFIFRPVSATMEYIDYVLEKIGLKNMVILSGLLYFCSHFKQLNSYITKTRKIILFNNIPKIFYGHHIY